MNEIQLVVSELHVVIGLWGYLLLEGFNPNPLCTDTERNKTHKERQNVHIFVLRFTQSDIVHETFTKVHQVSLSAKHAYRLLKTDKHA